MIIIRAAVGAGAPNRAEDVRTVQSALNQLPPERGGPVAPLVVDGRCGLKLLAAIARYQLHHFGWTDWRVDPRQGTARSLTVVRASEARPLPGRPADTALSRMSAGDVERMAAALPQAPPSEGERASIIGTIAAVDGPVLVNGQPARPGTMIPRGARVSTSDLASGARVTIRFTDGQVVRLGSNMLVVALGRGARSLDAGGGAPTTLQTGRLRTHLATLTGQR